MFLGSETEAGGIRMLGAIVNAAAVIIGGGIGLACGGRIKKRYTDALLAAIGLATFAMGVVSAVGTSDVLCIIICCALGTVLGELMRIDDGVNALGGLAERRLGGGGRAGGFTSAFVSCTILFCVGSMTVMGSIEAGLNGDYSILFAKSVLDFISSLVYGAALGIGAPASFVCVLIIEGGLSLLASALGPFLTEAVVAEMSAVGGVLLIGLAVNLLGLRREPLKIANMLPAVFLPAAYVPLYNWLSAL